jgi:hypothetical protein
VEVFALARQLPDQALELGHARLGGADRPTVLAQRVAAGLTRVQPVLDRAGEQPIGDVPQVRLLVLARDPVAQIHGLAEGGVEGVGVLVHAAIVPAYL